ncbi:MAG: hypothetical protein Q8N95_01830, partial [Desulfobacterales bacterium]|nr:hypothetical protein [Desulfobacterales bacterium]
YISDHFVTAPYASHGLRLLMPVTAYGSLCRPRLTAPYAGHGLRLLMPVTAYGSLCRSPHFNVTVIFERRLTCNRISTITTERAAICPAWQAIYVIEPKQRAHSPPKVPPISMAGGLPAGNLQLFQSVKTALIICGQPIDFRSITQTEAGLSRINP